MADGGQFVTIKSSPGEPEGPRPNEERGVHNPRVIDLIGLDAENDQVYLLMLELRPFGTEITDRHFANICSYADTDLK